MLNTYLLERRFLSIFSTQCLNAFNDNLLKNALVLLIAYQNYTLFNLDSKQIISVASFLFTLPFFIFSPHAGFLSDKQSKPQIIRGTKLLEIFIMLSALIAFYLKSIPILIFILFLMGTQSAFFGPAKLSILPELMKPKELLGTNSVFATGTFIAILLGTAVGGVAVSLFKETPWKIGALVFITAVVGYLTSLLIPRLSPIPNSNTKPRVNFISAIKHNLTIALAHKHLRYPIFLTGWMWFFGSFYLIIVPNFTKDYLGADETVATFLMATFSIGIALGAISSNLIYRFSKSYHSIVLAGITGMLLTNTLTFIFYWNNPINTGELIGLKDFFTRTESILTLINFTCLAASAGLFIVPLQTFIQHRAPDQIRSQVISCSNIVQSLLILLASTLLFILFRAEVTIPEALLGLSILNVLLLGFYLQNRLEI